MNPERTESIQPGQRSSPLGGLHLGRVFGVDVSLDPTLLIVFVLVATSLGKGTLPRWHPDWSAGLVWAVALGAAVLFFASVLAHELSHALVAKAQGTPVRGITLFMLGGVAQIDREPSSPMREFAMAIVGPLTSIAIGVVCTAIGAFELGVNADLFARNPSEALAAASPITTLMVWLGPLNLMLGIFNLVPGFPLDGGRVLRSILWALTGNLERASTWAAFVGQLFGWTLTALGVMMAFGAAFPIVGGGFVQGIWFVLLGFYLSNAARASIARVAAHRALTGVPVRDLMLTRFDTVERDMPLEKFVQEHLLGSDQRCFPVTAGGRFVGLVSADDVQLKRDERTNRTVGDVMTPVARIGVVRADACATDALDELTRRNAEQIVVVDHGAMLAGILRQRDIVRWLSLHEPRGHDDSGGRRAGLHSHPVTGA